MSAAHRQRASGSAATQLLRALSLLAALALLGGAVLDAQTGLVRQALGAAPDAGDGSVLDILGRDESYLHGSKSMGGFDLGVGRPTGAADAGVGGPGSRRTGAARDGGR